MCMIFFCPNFYKLNFVPFLYFQTCFLQYLAGFFSKYHIPILRWTYKVVYQYRDIVTLPPCFTLSSILLFFAESCGELPSFDYNKNNSDTTEVGNYPDSASPLYCVGYGQQWLGMDSRLVRFRILPLISGMESEGPSSGDSRVLQAGSWHNNSNDLRSALRYSSSLTTGTTASGSAAPAEMVFSLFS